MIDSRVSVWTNTTTHATGSTSNTGPTIDLLAFGVPVGGSYEQNPRFGIGAEILQTNTSGTAQVTTWEWEISNDDSTWYNGGYIGKNTLSTASAVYRLKTGLPTTMRYARADLDLKRQALSQVFPDSLDVPVAGRVRWHGAELTRWLRRL